MGTIFTAILEFFIELVFSQLLGGLFSFIQTIGLLWIRAFREDPIEIKALRNAYAGKPLPWCLGFGTIGAILGLWWWILA